MTHNNGAKHFYTRIAGWRHAFGLVLAFLILFGAYTIKAQEYSGGYAPWAGNDQAQKLKTHLIRQRLLNDEGAAVDASASSIGHQETARDQNYAAQSRTQPYTSSQRHQNISTAPLPYSDASKGAHISALEEMYQSRVIDELEQFGYDMFGVPKDRTLELLNKLSQDQRFKAPMGAVQDDFVLNSGDEVEIAFSGQRSDNAHYTINNDGLLIIKDFPPIPASGRTIDQVRLSLEAAAMNMYNTKVYISLSSVRQISVLVVGHVKKPGKKSMTVFHTIVDALMEAGGIDKTGSLRQIKLVRGGRSILIDLYSLLMHGAPNIDMNLRDGDRLVIPPIGPTVAVAGSVKRPGIYEILPQLQGMHHKPASRSEKLSLNEMLELAGGTLVSGQNRFLKLGLNLYGDEHLDEISDGFAKSFGDGAILMVTKGAEKRTGYVELRGHARKGGYHDLARLVHWPNCSPAHLYWATTSIH